MNLINFDQIMMAKALLLAQKAATEGEIPVGAIVVQTKNFRKDKGRLKQDDKSKVIISCGVNSREKNQNALLHAEIEAIDKACKKLGRWRLFDCDLYVTLEPCPMCAGAIINSRINRLIFGAFDYKAGACGSVINLFDNGFNHKPFVTAGIMENQCKDELSEFFKRLRNK